MTHYYITDDNTQSQGFTEITEIEWNTLMNTKETRPYAIKVYYGKFSINDRRIKSNDYN